MKLKDVKPVIDRYFAETTPEDIIKIFEEMGVQFEDVNNDELTVCGHPVNKVWQYNNKRFCDNCKKWLSYELK